MTALLTDNLPLLTGAPNGIKKLRELILELAVRGKLVPQDPNDEPASELLKRIAEEKTRLMAEGKIKKPKSLPDVETLEKLYDLPAGWEWTTLPGAASYQIGKTPPTKEAKYWDDSGLPWVSISDMEHYGEITETSRRVSKIASKDIFIYRPIPAGTLLMSFKLTVGKVAILSIDAYHNEAIISLSPYNGVSKEYLFRFLPSIALGGQQKNALMGNTLNSESMAQLLMPIPPLAEQHRIVAKVDELMALCDRLEAQQADADSAHTQMVQALLDSLTQASDADDFAQSWQRLAEHFHTLFTTESSIDALKRAILELAVMGKLSAPQQGDTSIAEILKKMAEDRNNKGPKEQETEKNLKNYLSTIENNRTIVRADFICGFITKGTTPAKNDLLLDGEIPFLKVYNIIDNKIDFHYRPTFISKEISHKNLGRSKIYPGDVVMNIVGPPLGKVAIIPDQFSEWNMNQALSVFRVKSGALNKYIYYMLLSESVLKSVISESKGSAGQDNLSLAQCRALLIPIPSPEEQHRIVAKVDQLMALCDQLKSRLAQARQLHEQLASTLVEQAVA